MPRGPSSRRSLCALLLGSLLVLPSGLAGCNPSLFTGLGVSAGGSLDAPEGYIVILLANRTTSSVQATLTIDRETGESTTETVATGPLGFFAVTHECDVISIAPVTFAYAGVGGAVEVPAPGGELVLGENYQCGQILLITADGNPPTFGIEVY